MISIQVIRPLHGALVLSLAMLLLGEFAAGERRVRDRQTIAHECLKREFEAAGTGGATARLAIRLLDSIIVDVAARLPSRINSADPSVARECLSSIEATLAAKRFYVSIPTSALGDTLIPSPAPRGKKPLTRARREAIQRSPTAPCHRMDCDTGSILYTAIGEALGLPIVTVEAPGHKFVRWQLTGRQHINWDTNAAREYTNNDFRRGRTLTYKTTIHRTEESAGKFLTNLTRRELLAYHRNIVAGIHEERRRHRRAVSEYEKALKIRPHDSLAANNLAWLYLDTPGLRTSKTEVTALELAKRATGTLPRNRDYQDTLARAYAANGKFTEAISAETNGYKKRAHIALFKQRKAY